MSQTPSQQKVDHASWDVTIEGAKIPGFGEIQEIHVSKGLNRVPTAKVILSDGNPAEQKFEHSDESVFEPGKAIKISAGYHETNETIFEGIVTTHRIRMKAGGASDLIIHCSDVAVKMTHVRKNRYFAPSKDDTIKDVDIFNKILGEYGVADKVDSTDSEYEDVTQFNSTDWDFLMIRAQRNGMIMAIDDGKVSIVKPAVTEGPATTVVHGKDIIRLDVEANSRRQIPKVTTNAWDYSANAIVTGKSQKPEDYKQGNLDGDKLAEVLEGEEYILHHPGPLVKADLDSWATSRLLTSRLSRIQGTVIFHGFAAIKPNQTLKFEGLSERFNGEAYVSEVSHHIHEAHWVTECTLGFTDEWFAENTPNTGQVPASGLIPPVTGLQIGVVKDIHTDPRGEIRVLVDVPVIEPEGKGLWARLAHFYATNEAGLFFMPEIGDEAVLGFFNQDPRFPIILGTMYSNTHVAPYTPDEENTYKAFVTNTKMKIEFEDVKRILTIWTPNENYMIFSDDEGTITIEDENKNKMVMSADGINMYTPKDFVLLADQNISIEAGVDIAVKAGANYANEAGANWDAKAGANLTAEGSAMATLKAGGQTIVKGGMVMIN